MESFNSLFVNDLCEDVSNENTAYYPQRMPNIENCSSSSSYWTSADEFDLSASYPLTDDVSVLYNQLMEPATAPSINTSCDYYYQQGPSTSMPPPPPYPFCPADNHSNNIAYNCEYYQLPGQGKYFIFMVQLVQSSPSFYLSQFRIVLDYACSANISESKRN